MKRSLEILPTNPDDVPAMPIRLHVGKRAISVTDDCAGAEARRLAAWIVDAGGQPTETTVDLATKPLRVLIRTRANARRADPDIDLVLGSARPRFAAGLVPLLLGDA